MWLRWQVLKLQIHLCEFYGASTETLYAARDAATAFLEKHKEEIDALLANVELRRLPQQLLLPYGEKENEGPTIAAASATDWCNGESQASAEAWQQQAYQQQLQQQYAALGFDCSQLYSCYSGAVQQQQMMLAAVYGQQPQADSTCSSFGCWAPSAAAAAVSTAASTVASSCSSTSIV